MNKELSFDELTQLAGERMDVPDLQLRLAEIVRTRDPTGVAVLICELVGSSSFGQMQVWAYGGECSLPEAPTGIVTLDGLASRTFSVVGVVLREELDRGLAAVPASPGYGN